MDEYEELVAKAFRLDSPLPFSNDSAAHARVIMKHILSNASGRVCLYSDLLPQTVEGTQVYDWSELLSATKQFLDQSTANKLFVKVAEKQNVAASGLLIDLLGKYPNQSSIVWGVGKKGPNFIASESGSFRLEYTGAKAIACANGDSVAKKLLTVFDTKLQ